MSTPAPNTRFAAYADGDLVLVRIVGPGVCRESGRFENLLHDVEARHPSRLVMDLSECPRLDSTFAGALLRLADRAVAAGFRVYVGGAGQTVLDLLDTLCLGDELQVVDLPDLKHLAEIPVEDRDLPREKVIALSLEGHERLAALSEENARRFASLLAVLRDQLPKAGVGAGGAAGCPP